MTGRLDNTAREEEFKGVFDGNFSGVKRFSRTKKDISRNRMGSCRDENGNVGMGDDALQVRWDLSRDKTQGIGFGGGERDEDSFFEGFLVS